MKNIFLFATVFFLMSCGASKKNSAPVKNTNSVLAENSLQKKYATLLGVLPQTLTNTALYSFIEGWIETPYAYGGQTKSGVDCSGFSNLLFSEVYKKQLPRSAALQYNSLQKMKSVNELIEGDLVFFKTDGAKNINHVGVYLHNYKMINATTSAGVVISDINAGYWKDKFIGGGTVK